MVTTASVEAGSAQTPTLSAQRIVDETVQVSQTRRREMNLEAQRHYRERVKRHSRRSRSTETLSSSRALPILYPRPSLSTVLQNLAALTCLVALIITGFYAVRMYRLAMWTAWKDAIVLCQSSQVQTYHRRVDAS